jgi:hypothetical protein
MSHRIKAYIKYMSIIKKAFTMLFDTPVIHGRVAQEITIIKAYMCYTFVVLLFLPLRVIVIKEDTDGNNKWNMVYLCGNLGTLVLLAVAYALCKKLPPGRRKGIIIGVMRQVVCIICLEMPLLDRNPQKAVFESYTR